MSIRFILLILFFMVCWYCVPAQPNNYRFHRFGVDEGLSQSSVLDILQDRSGFMWFATEGGLNRFDGYHFKAFTVSSHAKSGLTSQFICALAEDKEGNIWLATLDKGLLYLNPKTQKFTAVHFAQAQVRHDRINCIYIDKSGIIWIGTDAKGLLRYNRQKNTYTYFQYQKNNPNSLSHNDISAVREDKQGNIWIATNGGGLNCYNTQTNTFKHFRPQADNPNSLSSDFLRKLHIDSKGVVWIGSSKGGLIRFEAKKQTFKIYRHQGNDPESMPNDEAYSIAEDNQGRIWIGTWSRGIAILDTKTDKLQGYKHNPDNSYSLPDDVVVSVYRDNLGRMWLGTYYGGVCYHAPQDQKFVRFQHDSKNANSLTGNKIVSVLEDSEGKIWIGTFGLGLNCYTSATNQFEVFKSEKDNPQTLANRTAWCLLEDSKKRVWVGTSGGIHLYNRANNSFKRFQHNPDDSMSLSNNNVFCTTEDREGYLWIGTWYGGLNRLDTETGKCLRFRYDFNQKQGIPSDNIKYVWADRKNRLWVGTGKGIACYDIGHKRWIALKGDLPNDSLTKANCNIIYEDSHGRIWIGTSGKGLLYWEEKSNKLLKYSPKNLQIPDMIAAIQEDKRGNFWLSTTQGLACLDLPEQKIRHFDKEDGLQGNEFSEKASAKGKSGYLYFGGVNGLNMFLPTEALKSPILPKAVIYDFLIFNKPVDTEAQDLFHRTASVIGADRVHLFPHEFIFAFEYTATQTNTPHKIQYAYQLSGFDNNWIYTTPKDRKATYTRVPHGDYVFKVKAGIDGIWSDKTATLKVKVLPHLWETLTVRIIFVVLFLVLLLAVYKIRVSFIEVQKRALEKQVKERTNEISQKNQQLEQQKEEIISQAETLKTTNQQLLELDQFKQSMTGMIVHDLKNPLNALLNISPKKISEYVPQIQNYARQMQNLVLNILDVQKFEEAQVQLDKKITFFNHVVQEAIQQTDFLIQQKNIQIQIKSESNLTICVDNEMIVRVIVNLLTNAIKYSSFNQSIELEIMKRQESVFFSLKDYGSGIPADKLEKVFDKFVQIEVRSSRGMRSTGLGLTYCKMVIEAHGGEIGVVSEYGKGASFWFALPLPELQYAVDPVEKTAATNQIKEYVLDLSTSDKDFLSPYLPRFADLEVYYTTELEGILDAIPADENERLLHWKKRLRNAIFSMNQLLYEEILQEAKS
jgi:ligand-binding sensor domain-containing protein/signal transduction histidine kinase